MFPFIPMLIGAILGAGTSLIRGGGAGDALKGAAMGAAGGGIGSAISGAIGGGIGGGGAAGTIGGGGTVGTIASGMGKGLPASMGLPAVGGYTAAAAPTIVGGPLAGTPSYIASSMAPSVISSSLSQFSAPSLAGAGLSSLMGGQAGGSIAPMKSGILSSIFGGKTASIMSNPWALALGGGLGLDYFAKRRQTKETRKGIEEYLGQVGKAQEAAMWTPEKREGMMKGISGLIAETIGAGKKRAARGAAVTGRGGGSYGKEVERLRRTGLETGARALAETYSPTSIPVPSVEAYMAKSRDPLAEWMKDVLGLGGTAVGLAGAAKLARAF